MHYSDYLNNLSSFSKLTRFLPPQMKFRSKKFPHRMTISETKRIKNSKSYLGTLTEHWPSQTLWLVEDLWMGLLFRVWETQTDSPNWDEDSEDKHTHTHIIRPHTVKWVLTCSHLEGHGLVVASFFFRDRERGMKSVGCGNCR